MKKTQKCPVLHIIYSVFLLILPPTLFFSYFPVISLGGNSTMNFELSLPLIWLVLFDLLGLILLIQSKSSLHFKKLWPWLLFPTFLTLSLAWSLNPLRGLLTVGVLWLIYFAVFCFFTLRKTIQPPKNFTRIFWRIFFASSLIVSAWCWLQSILDLAGLSQSVTLMCDGCTSVMFGFPHPNGFAIEPQFMGNLLLAPTLFAAYFTFHPDHKPKFVTFSKTSSSRHKTTPSKSHQSKSAQPHQLKTASNQSKSEINLKIDLAPILRYFTFFFLAATLFLTMSRGAIYAFIIGLILLTILKIYHEKTARPLWAWLVVVLAFLFTLNAQGIMAEASPTNDTYQSGVAKVVHQLSLGLIDFRDPAHTTTDSDILENITPAETAMLEPPVELTENVTSENVTISTSEPNTEPEPSTETTSTPELDSSTETNSDKPASIFDGYVTSSTDARMNLTTSALYIWQTSPRNILVGVGLGGAGQSLYDFGESPAPKEIVQNEYASLLLETGLIGVLLAVFTLFLIFRAIFKSSLKTPLFALLAAYAITLFFFSGLPNALQIYLLPPLILFVSKLSPTSHPTKSQAKP